MPTNNPNIQAMLQGDSDVTGVAASAHYRLEQRGYWGVQSHFKNPTHRINLLRWE